MYMVPSDFIITDMESRSKNNKRTDQNSTKDILKLVQSILNGIFKKNNDNGQIISYVEDKVDKENCFVRAFKRIKQRALRY